MESYTTVSEALEGLLAKGYDQDLNLRHEPLQPEHYQIDEIHRFEGETDPADEMILYAISSRTQQLKGTFLNAYGIYADHISYLMVNNLSTN